MKKELNPAVAIGMIAVVLVGIAVYFWRSQGSRTLPSIPRGSIQRPGGGDSVKPGASGG